jgi:hypothetical protein
VVVRGVGRLVAMAFILAPHGADSGERRFAGGFELLPLVAPRAPAAQTPVAPQPQPRRVCVRLCDGFFFPVPASAAPDADTEGVCRALCPSAGVALYTLPANSDRIEDAANGRGEAYAALPTAFRYRSAGGPACACRRAGEPGLAYWRDPTLKSGDAVMTANGIVVFRGAVGGAPYTAEAFIPVDAAPLGATKRAAFGAMTPAASPDLSGGDVSAIGEARRTASSAAGEIRFLETPSGGGG